MRISQSSGRGSLLQTLKYHTWCGLIIYCIELQELSPRLGKTYSTSLTGREAWQAVGGATVPGSPAGAKAQATTSGKHRALSMRPGLVPLIEGPAPSFLSHHLTSPGCEISEISAQLALCVQCTGNRNACFLPSSCALFYLIKSSGYEFLVCRLTQREREVTWLAQGHTARSRMGPTDLR